MKETISINFIIPSRIDAKYEDHVEGKEVPFKAKLLEQVARVLNTDESNIRQLTVEKGSIMVFFRLVGNEDEVGALAESYNDFVKLLASGKWTLVILKQ